MRRPSKYITILIIGFVLWIAETAAFGFNEKPENGLERALDFVAITLMIWGLLGDLLSNLTIVKKTYVTENNNITTKKVECKGDNQQLHYHFGTTKEETRELITAGRDKPKKAKK